MVNRVRMSAQLILHEGLKLSPYVDTLGNITIGVGYNVTGRGWAALEAVCLRKVQPHGPITRDEALAMLAHDIAEVEQVIPRYFPAYTGLDEVRQRVCLDMAFNMGFRALSFKNTMVCIAAHDYSGAARHLWKSKWANQVGDGPGGKFDRADRLTRMLLTGQDYTP